MPETAGAGGSAINLSAKYDSLKVHGEDHIRTYRAKIADPESGRVTESPAERKFCGNCGSALWLWDPRWPELMHPHASVIDTDLPIPPDATEAMLDQARDLAASCGLANVAWRQGDVYALPFDDGSFDIATCRFAFHHFEAPERAFAEMARVCKSGGRLLLCDAVASDDPEKAAAFNAMERYRDPSTAAFRDLAYLARLFAAASLPEPAMSFYQVPVELNALLKLSFPVVDDRDGLRAMIVDAIDGDSMGVNARWDGDRVRFEYAAAILATVKP